jgi:hypothetical protein
MKSMETKGTRLLISLLVVLFSVTACGTADDGPELPEEGQFPGVDERLWPYFVRFEEQAKERGFDINLREEGITGTIESVDEENVLGVCHFNGEEPNHVVIDEEFFNAVGDMLREYVIFHELGHCSLFRNHLETADEHGYCISIMSSGLGDCRDNYITTTRSTYLDELFDPERSGDIFDY